MTVRILIGDVRDQLRTLADDSVDCVVTSVPYWGQRDYGVAGQIGMEPSIDEHLAVMVDVFREIRRVVTPTAAVWVNYGDCYATTPNGRSAAATKAAGTDDRTFRDKPFSTIGGGLKAKDLCLLPFRFALALQADGWWIRSRAMWGKPNAMPDSSGRYRPSVAHEEMFLFCKTSSPQYDAEAVKKPSGENTHSRVAKADKFPENWEVGAGTHGSFHRDGRESLRPGVTPKSSPANSGIKSNVSFHAAVTEVLPTRFLRTYEPEVWEIPTAPFAESHFATFPTELVQRCLMASAKPGQTVLDPFGGAGTTGLVAESMGMDSIMIELNPEYAAIADNRIRANIGKVEGPPLKRNDLSPLLALMEAAE